MARFSSARSDPDRSGGASEGAPQTLSILARGMCVIGELRSDGVVKIEGKVEGSVRAKGQVLVVKGGVVEGDIFTREAVVGGEVRGAIFADERVELQTSSKIDGDVTTPQIIIQEGGEINGNVRMANPQALKQSEKLGGAGQQASPTHRSLPQTLVAGAG